MREGRNGSGGRGERSKKKGWGRSEEVGRSGERVQGEEGVGWGRVVGKLKIT